VKRELELYIPMCIVAVYVHKENIYANFGA